jgi:WD40 repeat protein
MKHIFYAALFCSFSAHAMNEQPEPAHQMLMQCGEFPKTFKERRFSNYSLSLSSKSNLLAGLRTNSDDGTEVKIWDSSLGTERASLSMQDTTQAMLLSRDDNSLFLGRGKVVEIWDVETQLQKVKANISICNDGNLCFAEHPSEPTLAVGSGCGCNEPNNLSFVDLRSGQETKVVAMPRCLVSLAYCPNGEKLAFLWEGLIPSHRVSPPCIIVESANPHAVLKSYEGNMFSFSEARDSDAIIEGFCLAFDAEDKLHYGYGNRHDGTIFSKNLDTGAITRSKGTSQIVGFTFNPTKKQFITCKNNAIAMWRPEEISHAALSIVQRAKKALDTLAQEKEGIEALEKWERQWVSDHVRDLAKWAANLTFNDPDLK